MWNMVKALLKSRKAWLTVAAVIAAAVNGQYWAIPGIIMAEVGAITVEDAAAKLGLKKGAVSVVDGVLKVEK